MDINLCYISAACNRTPNSCDWGRNGLICYGSCNAVIIYNPENPETNGNVKTLIGHTNRVNAVKWIKCQSDNFENELVSASNDGTAIVWSLVENDYKRNILKGHEDGVNVVDAIYPESDKNTLLVVTASIDSTCRIWTRNKFGDEFSNIQTLDFDRGLCLALSLTFLPKTNNILLACARDNSKIQLYTQFEDESSKVFRLIETLKGHENWVRGLDFTSDDDGNVLLASSSQDSFIRIWCISPKIQTEDKSIFDMLTTHKMRAMESSFSISRGMETKYFSIHLESVLCGHEGWVYGVNWSPKVYKNDCTITQPMQLLSSSLDKTMLIWTLDESTGFWMETVRVGEVGGNTLGFYGGKFSPDGQSIVGHSYLGSFHLWTYSKDSNSWEPDVTVGGHHGEVVDLSWEPEGEFLISVSMDQTTRIHAPWINNKKISWHELARPQVHGYDMSCLSIISRYKFVTGAEEKIVRAFTAPSNFISNFRRICNISNDIEGDEILNESVEGPKGASVPSLGLSNKAVYKSSNHTQPDEKYPEETHFHEIQLTAPPTEENLLQNTLWPEIQKLYGHGYEIFSLAASSDKTLVASACKATSLEHAAIILWDVNSWNMKQKLLSHTLTVTQIMFSPDNQKILSVSRDRRWSIFEKNAETDEFKLAATTDKKNGIHTRIIWCCSWSHDSKYFVTGSRDGKAVVWWKNPDKIGKDSLGSYEAVGVPLELKGESITAIAFAPVLMKDCYVMCLGLETGIMIFYKWNLNECWKECLRLNQNMAHHLTVKRIYFRPKAGVAGIAEGDKKLLQVASCSADHSVKVFEVCVKECI